MFQTFPEELWNWLALEMTQIRNHKHLSLINWELPEKIADKQLIISWWKLRKKLCSQKFAWKWWCSNGLLMRSIAKPANFYRIRGAVVACLTPDQNFVCSSDVKKWCSATSAFQWNRNTPQTLTEAPTGKNRSSNPAPFLWLSLMRSSNVTSNEENRRSCLCRLLAGFLYIEGADLPILVGALQKEDHSNRTRLESWIASETTKKISFTNYSSTWWHSGTLFF